MVRYFDASVFSRNSSKFRARNFFKKMFREGLKIPGSLSDKWGVRTIRSGEGGRKAVSEMMATIGEGFAPPVSCDGAKAAQGQATDDARNSSAAASVAVSQNSAVASQAAVAHAQANDQAVQAAISQATGKGMRVNSVV
jgi:hypothetical protein